MPCAVRSKRRASKIDSISCSSLLAAGWLTPTENRDKRLWFVRDHPAIASALGWGAVAPFYVDLEQPAPENGIPRPGPLDVHLKDDHLQYAVTWFLLAGAVLIAFAVWARGRRQS